MADFSDRQLAGQNSFQSSLQNINEVKKCANLMSLTSGRQGRPVRPDSDCHPVEPGHQNSRTYILPDPQNPIILQLHPLYSVDPRTHQTKQLLVVTMMNILT